jgi:hypothetical protein
VAQLAALREWGTVSPTGRYATKKNIIHPTLIVHGSKDSGCADQRMNLPFVGEVFETLKARLTGQSIEEPSRDQINAELASLREKPDEKLR